MKLVLRTLVTPHPALRPTFSLREKGVKRSRRALFPSPMGRGCREAAGEGIGPFNYRTQEPRP